MVILEAQITQICSMNVLRLITDFIKMSKVWFLSMEFYGVWQLLAKHFCSMSYISVDDAIEKIITLGPGALLAKIDV